VASGPDPGVYIDVIIVMLEIDQSRESRIEVRKEALKARVDLPSSDSLVTMLDEQETLRVFAVVVLVPFARALVEAT